MKKALIVGIVISTFLSCTNENTETSNETSFKSKTTVNNELEMTVIQGLKFFITESYYKSHIDTVLKDFIVPNDDKTIYGIGNYQFRKLTPEFINDSLYKVRFHGFHFDSPSIPRLAPKYLNNVESVINEKYGQPTTKNKVPHNVDIYHTYPLRIWNYGNKTIEAHLSPNEFSWWEIDLVIYRNDIIERINQAEQKIKDDKTNKGASKI